MHPCESFGPSKRPQQKLTHCNKDKNSSFCCSSVNHHFLDGAFTGRIKTNQNQNSLNTYWKPLRPHITQGLQITYCNHLRIFSVYILRLLTCGSGRAREAWMKELQVWNRNPIGCNFLSLLGHITIKTPTASKFSTQNHSWNLKEIQRGFPPLVFLNPSSVF